MLMAAKRRRRELREQLAIQTMAARGDPKAIQKALGGKEQDDQ